MKLVINPQILESNQLLILAPITTLNVNNTNIAIGAIKAFLTSTAKAITYRHVNNTILTTIRVAKEKLFSTTPFELISSGETIACFKHAMLKYNKTIDTTRLVITV